MWPNTQETADNAVFEKTIENIRNRSNVDVVNDERNLKALAANHFNI